MKNKYSYSDFKLGTKVRLKICKQKDKPETVTEVEATAVAFNPNAITFVYSEFRERNDMLVPIIFSEEESFSKTSDRYGLPVYLNIIN